ncbi:hypothetical protein K1719_036845 [Acacia pycnantha]|nr:hypothetical protein K1719_036845 [Acacia pycnantha]
MVESDRLNYIRKHQKELRVDLYSRLSDAVTRGETDPSSMGRGVILPSSFTGGARYMIQNYQDAMAIYAWADYPDIFLTFTCNPMWPEIIRHCNEDGLKPCDRPDVLSRIFNMKLHKLMHILKDEKIFGTIKAEADKVRTPTDVDKIISAEIPCKDADPELYELVGSYMIHGPCGRSSGSAPCMKDGRCSKYFPKKYYERTMLDENGYPTYRRRNDNRTVTRKGIELDNRSVIPYNCRLLKLFQGHLNVEKTNQSRAIKYLFKYISKGHDRFVAGIYSSNDDVCSQQGFDEISHYLNCRYVSSCEASWRIFGFDIHHRLPPVERLSFYLPHQQAVYYTQTDRMSTLLNNPRVKESMFLAWMEKNKEDPFARTLCYSQFPNYFTFVREKRTWKDDCLYSTFREACYALGLLDDDNEFIDAIKEASLWASGNCLRGIVLNVASSGIAATLLPSGRTAHSRCPGIPHHKLVLKLGVPVMLVRNIDQAAGLCNGTRLQVTQLGKNVIKAKAMNRIRAGEEILIHRMDMNPSESKLPFNMTRRQFPIIISFAMTINKSQWQSMSHVGLYLPTPVFSHGQLYVALSRVKSFNGLRILILDECNKSSRTTTNVVERFFRT